MRGHDLVQGQPCAAEHDGDCSGDHGDLAGAGLRGQAVRVAPVGDRRVLGGVGGRRRVGCLAELPGQAGQLGRPPRGEVVLAGSAGGTSAEELDRAGKPAGERDGQPDPGGSCQAAPQERDQDQAHQSRMSGHVSVASGELLAIGGGCMRRCAEPQDDPEQQEHPGGDRSGLPDRRELVGHDRTAGACGDAGDQRGSERKQQQEVGELLVGAEQADRGLLGGVGVPVAGELPGRGRRPDRSRPHPEDTGGERGGRQEREDGQHGLEVVVVVERSRDQYHRDPEGEQGPQEQGRRLQVAGNRRDATGQPGPGRREQVGAAQGVGAADQ